MPFPSDNLERGVINACAGKFVTLHISVSSPPQSCFLKDVNFSHVLCSQIYLHSLFFFYLLLYLMTGFRLQGFPPSSSFAHPVIVVYTLQEEEGCSGEEGFSCHCIPENILPFLGLTSRLDTEKKPAHVIG